MSPDYNREKDIPWLQPLKEYDRKDSDQYLSEAKAYAQLCNWDECLKPTHKDASFFAVNCHQLSLGELIERLDKLLSSKSKGQ